MFDALKVVFTLYDSLCLLVPGLVDAQKFDPVRYLLEQIPDEGVSQGYFDGKVPFDVNVASFPF